LSNAPWISRKRLTVNCLVINPWWISVAKMSKLSVQEDLFRKPNWNGGRMPDDSIYQLRRYNISLSRIFRRLDVREIGRSLPGVDLGIRKTKEWCQELGKEPESKRLLRISNNNCKYASGRRKSIWLSIRSIPGADWVFSKRTTETISWIENGLSKILQE